MKPEIRAKKDKCSLVASVDHGKLRVLGASDDPIVVLEGQVLELRASAGQAAHFRGSGRPPDHFEGAVCELRAVGGQVHVIQRDAPRGGRRQNR
jgi:hypothetical protein